MKTSLPALAIAGASCALVAPPDLDAALVALTGCDAAETRIGLAGTPITGLVAAALLPFLAEPVPLADLAALIAEHDAADGVIDQVRALYDNLPATPALEGDPA